MSYMRENPMSSHSALEDSLSLLFAENVRAELVREQPLAEGVMYVAVMRYTKAGESGSLTSVEQTAVVVHDHRFDLPEFTVSPKLSGLAGWVQRLVGMRDISFSDSPEFSRRYHLFGWKEAAVRGLFTKELRSSFEAQARWSARGGREWIALFQDRFVCESLNLHEFIDQALVLLAEFQRALEKLDYNAESSRKVEMSDMIASLETYRGFGAAAMLRHLKKLQVTAEELSLFLKQSIPRQHIPSGLRAQVVGLNLMLVILGVFFCIIGLTVLLPLAAYTKGEMRMVLALVGTSFSLAGGGMAFATVWYRRGRLRLLSHGVSTCGVLRDVKRTGAEVNGAQQYHVHIDYQTGQSTVSTVMPLYLNVGRALELKSSGEPVTVLVDPEKPATVLCLDTLLIVEPTKIQSTNSQHLIGLHRRP